jgi:hypothetical protein
VIGSCGNGVSHNKIYFLLEVANNLIKYDKLRGILECLFVISDRSCVSAIRSLISVLFAYFRYVENVPLLFQNLFLEVLLWVLDEPLLLVEQRFFAWCGPNLFRVVMCDVMMYLMYTFGSKSLLYVISGEPMFTSKSNTFGNLIHNSLIRQIICTSSPSQYSLPD